MELTHACVDGPMRIDSESPFFVSFVMRHQRDDVVAVLIGDLARSFYGTLRIGDIIKVNGHFRPGGVMYPNNRQVFCITEMELPKSAKTGRNINVWT